MSEIKNLFLLVLAGAAAYIEWRNIECSRRPVWLSEVIHWVTAITAAIATAMMLNG